MTHVSIFVPDWRRGLLYYLAGANGGGMRRYAWALATQSPQLSVVASPGFCDEFMDCGDVDPITGHIIYQMGQTNAEPIRKVDHNSFAQLGSYGGITSFPSWPTSFWVGQQIVCVECNGVGYAVLKESANSAAFNVFRVSDTLNHAGFQGHLSGATNNRCVLTKGASGPTGGSIFATWQGLSPATASVPLYTIRIAPGAETYNPATWPATNPHITEATIGNISANAIDPTWTVMSVSDIGYDQADGNVLMKVTTPAGPANTAYLVKVSGTTAAVLWSVAMTDLPQLWSYDINGGEVGFLGAGHKDAVSMLTGEMATTPLNGVGLGQILPGVTAFWDGVHGWYFVRAAPYTQGTGTPQPVDGTPGSFTDYAILGPAPAPPGQTPKLWLLRQPELHFIGVAS